jgi:uncharacterized protein YoxC
MIFEICAIVGTIAFVVLVVYLIMTLRTVQTSLVHLDPIRHEVEKLLHKSNDITESVHKNMDSLDPLFRTVSNVGASLENVSKNLHKASFKVPSFLEEEEEEVSGWNDKLGDLLDLAAAGVLLWQHIKKKGDKHVQN